MRKSVRLLVLIVLVITLSAVSVTSFNFTINIQNSTYEVVQNVNVTITCFRNSCNGFGDLGPWSSLTNSTGGALINISLSNSEVAQGEYILTAKLQGADGNISQIGPSMPPMPFFALSEKLYGNTVYMGKAATIYITAMNDTFDSVPLNYHVKDTVLGMPIAETGGDVGQASNVEEARIEVLADRNYSIMTFTNGPPVSFSTTNYTEYVTSSDTIFMPVTINTTYSATWIAGYVFNDNGLADTYDELENINYFMESGSVTRTDFTIPSLSQFFGLDNNHTDVNASTGQYNITSVAVVNPHFGLNTTNDAPFIAGDEFTEVIGLFATNGTKGVNATLQVAFQNVTSVFGQRQIDINITLQNASGTYKQSDVQDDSGFGGANINFSSTQIVFQEYNSTSFVSNLSDVHGEMTVTYNFGNGDFDVKYMIDYLVNGQFNVFLGYNDTGTLKVFNKQFSPVRKIVNTTVLGTSPLLVNQTAFRMERFNPASEGGGEEGGFSKFTDSDIEMFLFKNTNACNVQYPDPVTCRIGDSGFSGAFDPLSSPIGGKVNIWMRTKKGTVTYFVGADLLASGPPDAIMSDESIDSATSSSSFDEFYKFGSLAPDIYDNVYIGVPYDPTSLDENGAIKVLLKVLYDDDGNVVWNSSVNTAGDGVPSDWSDYNTTWLNATLGGMPCDEVETADCLLNKTNKTIWLNLPHFSNVGSSITGAAVAASSSASSSSSGSSSSGSSNSGGIAGLAPKTTSAAKAKLTRVYGSISAGQSTTAGFGKGDLPVKSVTFTPGQSAKSVSVVAAALYGKPDNIDLPTGTVYEFLEIILDNVEEVTEAQIGFSVSEVWLNEHEIDADSVRLQRWTTEWTSLETEKIGLSEGEYIFEASTPGFSYFVISGESIGESIGETESTTTPSSVSEPSSVELDQSAEEVIPSKKSSVVLWVVGLLIVLFLIYVFVPKKQ